MVCSIRSGRVEIIAERLHLPGELGPLVEGIDRLVAAQQLLHSRQRPDHSAEAGNSPGDLIPKLGQGVGQLVRTVGQLVQIASVVRDLIGCIVEFAADFAGLKRQLHLFQWISIGPSQTPHQRDFGQLADSGSHLLEVGKGRRRPQVVG